MSMKDTAVEVIATTIKSAPPVTVGGMVLFGISLSDWTLLMTCTYTAFLLFVLIRDKIYRPWKASGKAE
jgi:hypothetical protein